MALISPSRQDDRKCAGISCFIASLIVLLLVSSLIRECQNLCGSIRSDCRAHRRYRSSPCRCTVRRPILHSPDARHRLKAIFGRVGKSPEPPKFIIYIPVSPLAYPNSSYIATIPTRTVCKQKQYGLGVIETFPSRRPDPFAMHVRPFHLDKVHQGVQRSINTFGRSGRFNARMWKERHLHNSSYHTTHSTTYL